MPLNDHSKSVLQALAREPATRMEIIDITGMPDPRVRPQLGSLMKQGYIARDAEKCVVTNETRYALTDKGREAIATPADFANTPELQYLAPEDYKLPDADPALLASANRMLQGRLDDVAKALRRVGIPALEKADGCEALNGYIEVFAASWRDANKRAMLAESSLEQWRQIAIASGAGTPEELAEILADLRSESTRLRAENTALKTLNEAMPGFGAAHEATKNQSNSSQKSHQPRRPFSVTGLTGYHAGGGKVTLFLNRKLSARSITLPAGKLAHLVELAA